jgi:glycosidase
MLKEHLMEFHISRSVREQINLDDLLFSFTGNVIFANVTASRKLAERLNALNVVEGLKTISGAELFAMGLIDELSHALIGKYRKKTDPHLLKDGLSFLAARIGPQQNDRLLLAFTEQFPSVAVFRNEITAEKWLQGQTEDLSNREAAFEEMLLLWLANTNPAFSLFNLLFGDQALKNGTAYSAATSILPNYFGTRPPVESNLGTLLDALKAPMLASPDSLTGQLDYIREHWAPVLGEDLGRVLLAIDVLREEEIAVWMRFHPPGPVWHRHGDPGRAGEGFVGDEFIGFDDQFITLADGTRRRRYAEDYQAPLNEYEAFSADQAWMPTVVLIAKNIYVWLEQLSKKYGRHIHRLDQIPDEELQLLVNRGITGLWLIGLWERSPASRIIKRLRGSTDAVASAYSLKNYTIAHELGGEAAYTHLREHAASAGLRLASDMVPNHMGIDSDWVIDHPEWFLSRPESPFPVYRFDGPDVSTDSRVEIKIEDHYYDHSDAAVVFRLRHHYDGAIRYLYHGNDGTTFAWNDTAQLDYSKAEVRENVIQVILNVARRFPIIRFDAAMVLAKRHVQRLWFPLPGAGGSIPSRAENAMSQEAFDALMPHEFWREVVDRVAAEVPGTLLLAEAFWLLEGYFVRTLGMHRVYNSAFMNMLRDEENAKYRSYLKKTVEFDPDILKRYVNFMSNPDERTAIDQFGSGDKYFGVSVLLATLPGLPMFGHGQIEGFTERYGMDFKQARLDEYPNEDLVARHRHLIAPLLKSRYLFAESTHFLLYDFWNDHGTVNENIFAYSNRHGQDRALILYNNSYQSTHGTIHFSVGFLEKATGSMQQKSLAFGLNLPYDGSIMVAYRDNVVGLEYLHRATDIHHHGLTLSLRGYQHLALLKWRELRSTAAHPWDRLCDALNGSGVYSIDEALSRLQIRPLLEVLHQAVSPANINLFAKLSGKTQLPVEQSTKQPSVGSDRPTKKKNEIPDASTTLKTDEHDTTSVDPHLKGFSDHAYLFKERVKHLSELEGGSDYRLQQFATNQHLEDHDEKLDPKENAHVLFADIVAASVHLPALSSAFPESLQAAAAVALPGGANPNTSPIQSWAPVLTWLVFQTLPPHFIPVEVFEKLNLRWALAETFSSVGLEGEAAWKSAAQVYVLLKFTDNQDLPKTVRSETFWKDPDVRWLAGVNNASGTEYINLERFEELLCWIQVPALLKVASSDRLHLADVGQITLPLADFVQLLKQADFMYQRFLDLLLQNSELKDRSIKSELRSV